MSYEQKFLKSFDGTRIGYQTMGRGKTAFVLCNGLGGSAVAWSPLYNKFGDDFKFVTWDYRGLFTSDKPENSATLDIPYHVRDLEAVLKKEKIKKYILGGWSMGVQVALEAHRRQAKNILGYFLLNGTSGQPLETALKSPLAKKIVPVLNGIIKTYGPKIQPSLLPIAKRVIDSKDFIRVVTGLGLIHRNFDTTIFKNIASDIVHSDLGIFHQILDHLILHDASDVLPRIKVPTMIVAGTRDLQTPHVGAERMARRIPKAKLHIIEKASHYALLEFPELIQKWVGEFFLPLTKSKKTSAKIVRKKTF